MNAIVAGVHMVPFKKPGQQEPYRVMGAETILGALKDAGLDSRDIQQAYASFCYGDTGAGQHALYDAFQTGIPVFNVNNACCSGSSALYLTTTTQGRSPVCESCTLESGVPRAQTIAKSNE